jgi:hypothetical protein
MTAVIGWQAGSNIDDPNSGTSAERTIAKNSLEALVKHYPGYSWFVEVRDGLLMIRAPELDWRGRHAMVRKLGNVQHDYGRLVREVVFAAGEYLERANLRRGAAVEGVTAQTVDGIKNFVPAPSGILLPS